MTEQKTVLQPGNYSRGLDIWRKNEFGGPLPDGPWLSDQEILVYRDFLARCDGDHQRAAQAFFYMSVSAVGQALFWHGLEKGGMDRICGLFNRLMAKFEGKFTVTLRPGE